jgi:hypothetical protein
MLSKKDLEEYLKKHNEEFFSDKDWKIEEKDKFLSKKFILVLKHKGNTYKGEVYKKKLEKGLED